MDSAEIFSMPLSYACGGSCMSHEEILVPGNANRSVEHAMGVT